MNIETIGIVGKQLPAADKKRTIIKKLVQVIEKFGEVKLDQYSAEILGKRKFFTREELLDDCDLVITMGGDGTVLKAARSVNKRSPKILGINMGNVGFLTEIHPNDLNQALKKIEKDQFELDSRFLLSATVIRGGKEILDVQGLNDAVINQGPFARLLTMSVKINRQRAFTLRADGLIVATPTGSTGHSLSAGGPVIHPRVDSIVINPLCPVLLSLRPMVVPGESNIIVKIAEKEGQKTEVRLTLDGQMTHHLEHGDEVHITKAPYHIDFIRLPGRTHYQMVEEKLHWIERSR